MRYPYDRLLLFFVSRKCDVSQALARYGLPDVGDLWVAIARTHIRKNAPYALARYLDSKDNTLDAREGILDWAESEGFRELWTVQDEFDGGPTPPDVDLAFRVFMNPYSRGTLGLLLLSKAGPGDILEIFQERYDVALSDSVLDLYKRIFWDTATMGRKSWEEFLPKLKTKQERHDLALGIGSPAMEDVRDIVGMNALIDPEHIVSQIATKSYLQFQRAMEEPSPEGSGVKMWMDAALRSAKQLHAMRPKKNNDDGTGIPSEGFEGLFSVELSKSAHPTLAELQGEIAQPKVPVPGKDEG